MEAIAENPVFLSIGVWITVADWQRYRAAAAAVSCSLNTWLLEAAEEMWRRDHAQAGAAGGAGDGGG